MDNQRLFLLIALSFVILLMFMAWQEDYGEPRRPPPAEVVEPRPDVPAPPPTAAPPADVPVAPAPTPDAVPVVPGVERLALPTAERVRVVTDVLDVELDTVGGDVRRANLLLYPVDPRRPEEPVTLLTDAQPYPFVVQSGLLADREVPAHHAPYRAEASEYRLALGQDELVVPLHWTSPDGLEVTKLYTFRRDSYAVQVDFEVRNATGEPVSLREYRQLQRTDHAPRENFFIYTYTGGVVWSPDTKYEKIRFTDMATDPLNRFMTTGWAAMIQHYFLAAWVPPADEPFHYYSAGVDANRYVLGMTGPEVVVGPGEARTLSSRLVIGPKLQDHLAEIAPGLNLTVDYGLLTFIAQPLFWLLRGIQNVVGNWGWAIIILTLMIKLVFYKLSETSYRSMANMRRLQPRLMALKERYGDDRQRLNQAMMELYKKEKINPLSGCLPILVQIPVFIALYWVLLESVELRQASFILWLRDLSTPDPYFVLPLIMGASMLVQMKLNPAPMDPMQQKIMMALPIVFTVFFAFFPAGLVLYWVVNNVLSIAQQWFITRRVEQATKVG
jgi:YidC/Oxa1 family membrane protein insertase